MDPTDIRKITRGLSTTLCLEIWKCRWNSHNFKNFVKAMITKQQKDKHEGIKEDIKIIKFGEESKKM